jgi:restriction system protein
MEKKEITVWGIHAGEEGQASLLFFNKNVIAIGWKELGNLGNINPDIDTFKTKISEIYPNKKSGSLSRYGNMLYRFVYEMRIDDLVVFPSQTDRLIYIGRITGQYQYSPELDEDYCNTRAVVWNKPYLKTLFTQSALYEIYTAMTLFMVKKHSDEYISAFEGKTGRHKAS